MKIEDIVCDFEYAEKLKEIGLKINTLFSFHKEHKSVTFTSMFDCHGFSSEHLNTYTVAELGEMLPKEVHLKGSRFHLFSKKRQSGRFDIAYYYDGICLAPKVTDRLDKKEANARAKLLIYLIENKYLTTENLK